MSTTVHTATTADIIESIRKRKYDKICWSREERLHRSRPIWRDPFLTDHEVSFKTGLIILFRRSVFGTFLKYFNDQQLQDKSWNEIKLAIFDSDMKSFSAEEQSKMLRNNLGLENGYSLLVEAVKTCDVIDWEFLFRKIECLRVSNFYINALDNFARKFDNLQVLVLCGNWLEDIKGENLPRRLKFLELYGNQITNLKNFVRKTPKGLLYIGLGRNRLTNHSKIDLLANCLKFGELKCLDLSENDISDLIGIVQPLARLQHLSCLQLEGNPCSVKESYKDIILKYHPKLVYLDNTQVLDEDKDIVEDSESGLDKAALVFTCHRIIGLPPPPKDKGVSQTFHVELILPLLEEIVIEPEIVEQEENEADNAPKKGKKSKKGKSDTSKKGKGKKGKGKKGKGKKASPYAAPDEYADEVRSKIKSAAFKTERLPWSKIIQYPEEAIVVRHPEDDFKAIRDTFRSVVNVKIVYLKIELPNAKKGKRKGKDKKSKKKAKAKSKKDSKKSVKDSKSNTEATMTTTETTEPAEIIQKKITLASFYCELHNNNWSDKTIDFYWADHPKANPNAIPVEGSLRSLHYAGDKEVPNKQNNETDIKKKAVLPNIFTCQVGFGLKKL